MNKLWALIFSMLGSILLLPAPVSGDVGAVGADIYQNEWIIQNVEVRTEPYWYSPGQMISKATLRPAISVFISEKFVYSEPKKVAVTPEDELMIVRSGRITACSVQPIIDKNSQISHICFIDDDKDGKFERVFSQAGDGRNVHQYPRNIIEIVPVAYRTEPFDKNSKYNGGGPYIFLASDPQVQFASNMKLRLCISSFIKKNNYFSYAMCSSDVIASIHSGESRDIRVLGARFEVSGFTFLGGQLKVTVLKPYDEGKLTLEN